MYNNLFLSLTPLSAYWLGFMASDGCVTHHKAKSGKLYPRMSFGLKYEDRYMVRQFLVDVGCSHLKASVNKTKTYVQAVVGSSEAVAQLLLRGICPRKSRLLTSDAIPNQYVSDFVRGLFDGDGSVGRYVAKGRRHAKPRFTIYGHGPFLEEVAIALREHLPGLLVHVNPNRKNIGVYQLVVNDRRSFVRVFDWIYGSSNERRLLRKHKVFAEAVFYLQTHDFTRLRRYKYYCGSRAYAKLECHRCGTLVMKRADKPAKFCSRKCANQRGPYAFDKSKTREPDLLAVG